MKRFCLIVAAFAGLTLAFSCGKNAISADGYANQGAAISKAPISPQEQKEKIEQTGIEFMNMIDVDNWKSTADFLAALAAHFSELQEANPYALDAFEDWAQEAEEAMRKGNVTGGKATIKTTVALSKVSKGTFTETDGEFEYSFGLSGVKIITYVDGETVTITITNGADGKEFEVSSNHWASEGDWDYEYFDGEDVTEIDETVCLKAPAWVNVEIKEGSRLRLGWKVNLNFSDSDGNGKLELEKDRAEIDTEVKFDDYVINASEKYYVQKGWAYTETASTLTKGGKLIVTEAFEGSGELVGNANGRYSVREPQAGKAAIDVLGKVQAKGTIDYAKMSEVLEELDPRSEDDYVNGVEKMEKYMDVAVYYDRKPGRQAWIGLEPFYDEYNRAWTYSPVIRFADGTSYAYDEFFGSEEFEGLLNALNEWERSVQDYFSSGR